MPCSLLTVLQDVSKEWEWDSSQRDLDAMSIYRQLMALSYKVLHFSAINYFFSDLLNCCVSCVETNVASHSCLCVHIVYLIWLIKHFSLTICYSPTDINFFYVPQETLLASVCLPLSENPCNLQQEFCNWHYQKLALILGMVYISILIKKPVGYQEDNDFKDN